MTLREEVNRLTAVLLVAIATLTATTIHYARALRSEQARSDHMAAIPAPAEQRSVNPTPDIDAAFSASDSIPGSNGKAREMNPSSAPKEERDVGTIAIARARLARLKDPERRAERTRQLADDARRSLIELIPVLGLSSTEVDRLVEASAGQAMQAEQQELECMADPACDMDKPEASMDIDELVAQLFGPEKGARLKAYSDSWEERSVGLRLRELLPPGTVLSDEAASKLAAVLIEERQRFTRAAEQSGEKIEANNVGFPVVTVMSAARPGSSDDSAQRQASATLYIQRRFAGASTVLNGEALERFRDTDEMALEKYKRSLREWEIADAARKAAGKPAARD